MSPIVARILLLAIAFWLPGWAVAAVLQVVFINPGAEDGVDVWTQVPRFMRVAAQQLDYKLEVLNANRDRIRMVEIAKQVSERATLPDYVLLVNEKLQAPEMMEFFRGKSTRIVLIHNDLTDAQRSQYGGERQYLPNWVGTLITHEKAIVDAMMNGLYSKGPASPRIVGIGGDASTPVSAVREQAVRDYVQQAGRGQVLQVVAGNWTRQDASDKARSLLQRYPEANMIWAANDTMALGAQNAVEGLQRQGQVRVGGMGAFPDALASVQHGGMAVTAGGGTLLNGALALVMIHDLEAGRDFVNAGGARQLNGIAAAVADTAAADHFKQLLENPARIDFRFFSLAGKSGHKAYRFDYPSVLAAAKLRP